MLFRQRRYVILNRTDHTLTTGTGLWPLRLARGPADRSLVSGTVGSEPDTLSGRRLRHGGDQQHRHLHSTHAHHGSDRECLSVSRLSLRSSVWLSLLPVSVCCLSAVCLLVVWLSLLPVSVCLSLGCLFVRLSGCLSSCAQSFSISPCCLPFLLSSCLHACLFV